MAMINFADKVALNTNSGIADINKCNATDMNELKNAFNIQVAFGWYKTGLNPTFTFVSYDSASLTGVVSSNLDLTPYLGVGMKIKFTQSSAIKYAIITAITSTQLTLFLGTDYTINNSAISDTYFSMLKSPYGFPTNPDKWSVINNITVIATQGSPVANTWYNLGSRLINVPIGCWNVEFESDMFISLGATATRVDGEVCLSTTNNGCTDNALKDRSIWTIGSLVGCGFKRSKTLLITVKTPYYLNYRYLNGSTVNLIGSDGASGATVVIKAVCAYL